MNLKNLLLSRFKDKFYPWVPVSSTDKVFCRRARDLGSNPAYTKNQLMSWLDGKSNQNSILTIKKKDKLYPINNNCSIKNIKFLVWLNDKIIGQYIKKDVSKVVDPISVLINSDDFSVWVA